MDSEKFKLIKDRYNNFLIWDSNTVDQKLFLVAGEFAYFQNLYITTSRKRSTLIKEMDSLFQGKWKYYRHNFDDAIKESDIHKFIEKDIDVLTLRSSITAHDIYMKYFEECMKNLNQLRWDIKSYIDYKKFQSGNL